VFTVDCKINITIIERLEEDLNKTLIYITDTELKTLVDSTLRKIIKTKNKNIIQYIIYVSKIYVSKITMTL
jgi:hypothetical protein